MTVAVEARHRRGRGLQKRQEGAFLHRWLLTRRRTQLPVPVHGRAGPWGGQVERNRDLAALHCSGVGSLFCFAGEFMNGCCHAKHGSTHECSSFQVLRPTVAMSSKSSPGTWLTLVMMRNKCPNSRAVSLGVIGPAVSSTRTQKCSTVVSSPCRTALARSMLCTAACWLARLGSFSHTVVPACGPVPGVPVTMSTVCRQ